MALIKRKIDIVLTYGTGVNGEGPPQAVTLSGYRVSVNCKTAGGPGMGTAQIRVFGMTLDLMNRLSTMGILPTAYKRNAVTVIAGDEVNGMAKIFEGTIQAAWADMMTAPDVAFNITALAGLIEALLPIPPSSYPGTADAAVIMANLAEQMGLAFENNGVSVILAKPYFPGAARQQMTDVAESAKIGWIIDNGVLAIWPHGGSRGGAVPLLSPETGLIGYPAYTSTGLVLWTQFNPSVRFGAKVQVKSELTPACGTWQVANLVHDLEAETPGGKWASQMQLAALGYLVVAK